VSATVAWGAFASDGSLGYEGGCCPQLRCRADLRECRLLSAHAPSKVVVECSEPVEVFGFLNASATFDPRNPVEFWTDWNFVGEVSRPAEATAPMKLAPGRHVLLAACENLNGRHTVWALRRTDPFAEADLTAVTIAAYPEAQVPTALRGLGRSARKQGIPVHVCFVGENYDSHLHMKVRRLRPVLESLRSSRVMYVDGRDCVFLEGLDRIDAEFRAMRAPVIMAAEAECHPFRDAAWASRFPKHSSGCNWLSAGQFMGDRELLVRFLRVLEDLSDRMKRAAQNEMPELVGYHRYFSEDDQLLWQIAWLKGLVELMPDYEGRVFRNVNTLDTTLAEENRHFDLRDGVVFKPSGRRPSVLHFSGSAANSSMHQWAGFIGAY
jgi:hypothetical protein